MTRGGEFDLDDFSEDDIIEHLEMCADDLNMEQIKRLKNITKEGEENLLDDALQEHEMYTLVSSSILTINDEIKLKMILNNLNKFNIGQISKIFVE